MSLTDAHSHSSREVPATSLAENCDLVPTRAAIGVIQFLRGLLLARLFGDAFFDTILENDF
jgi:hypothetical protein